VRLAFAQGGGEMYAFSALGKSDGLLWRRRGALVGFACAMWPFAAGEQGEVAIEALPATDAAGKAVDLRRGQAVRVTAPEGRYTVLVNYTGQELRCGELTSRGRVTVALGRSAP
jgi:hypothetical protein